MIALVTAHGGTDPWARLSYAAAVIISLTPFVTAAWLAWRKHEKRKATKVDALYVAIIGSEPTLDDPTPEPGILQRLTTMESEIKDVKREVTPNGGDTNRLGDRVKRLEQFVTGIDGVK